MEINDTSRIHNLKNNQLSQKEIQHIAYFVQANKQGLLDLANQKITRIEFFDKMILVNDDNEVINNVVSDEEKQLKYINGYAVVKYKDGLNYKRIDGTILCEGKVFSEASPFQNINDKLYAIVAFDDNFYYIDEMGNFEGI